MVYLISLLFSFFFYISFEIFAFQIHLEKHIQMHSVELTATRSNYFLLYLETKTIQAVLGSTHTIIDSVWTYEKKKIERICLSTMSILYFLVLILFLSRLFLVCSYDDSNYWAIKKKGTKRIFNKHFMYNQTENLQQRMYISFIHWTQIDSESLFYFSFFYFRYNFVRLNILIHWERDYWARREKNAILFIDEERRRKNEQQQKRE